MRTRKPPAHFWVWIYFLALLNVALLMPLPTTLPEARKHYLTNVKRVLSLEETPSYWKRHERHIALTVIVLVDLGALTWLLLSTRVQEPNH